MINFFKTTKNKFQRQKQCKLYRLDNFNAISYLTIDKANRSKGNNQLLTITLLIQNMKFQATPIKTVKEEHCYFKNRSIF